MREHIGFCGYNCHLCAARSEDYEIRKKMVEGWRKIFGHENYTPENVICAGCRNEGPHADTNCQARPCALEKGFTSCTECAEFPCAKMKNLMASKAGMLLWCYPRTAGISKEEYELCMQQFDSMSNLIRLGIKNGKFPDWLDNDLQD
ncbi:MAG: DUF3795 domain-containing protein [Candidatus Cloacimonetes bacterium]|nr:DUF3795 domain-containing protein [Candidatus Cloacimonadota bacterium]